MMKTKLELIAKKAKESPNERFTSIMHLVNKETLIQCHKEMPLGKAAGIDKVTKCEYEANLEENIETLLTKMKKFQYRPQPVRRTYIPKDGKKQTRPLGIPAYEDKLVQSAMNKVLNAIYESDFLDCSFGFRKDKNCHKALKMLNRYIENENINYIVDIDIKGFFDNIDHKILIKFLEHRIQDKNFLRYIVRFLKSGIMEKGEFHKSYKGAPQGGIISPTLGNIYLHYVLDLWFMKRFKKQCRGKAYLIRYADDAVCCFESKSEAEKFYKEVKMRVEEFNLEISEEKTKIVFFGAKVDYPNNRFK